MCNDRSKLLIEAVKAAKSSKLTTGLEVPSVSQIRAGRASSDQLAALAQNKGSCFAEWDLARELHVSNTLDLLKKQSLMNAIITRHEMKEVKDTKTGQTTHAYSRAVAVPKGLPTAVYRDVAHAYLVGKARFDFNHEVTMRKEFALALVDGPSEAVLKLVRLGFFMDEKVDIDLDLVIKTAIAAAKQSTEQHSKNAGASENKLISLKKLIMAALEGAYGKSLFTGQKIPSDEERAEMRLHKQERREASKAAAASTVPPAAVKPSV